MNREKLGRKPIDCKTSKEQERTIQRSERVGKQVDRRRRRGDREFAGGSAMYKRGREGSNGERMRDATAKSDRAVKITISLLWRGPCTLKREGPVSVGGIHHRARVTRRYFSRDAPRESIFYVDRAERAARPRRRWLFSPWRTKTLWIRERAEEREWRNRRKRDEKNLWKGRWTEEERERERPPLRKGFWLHGQNSSRKWNFFTAIPRSRAEKASVAIHPPSPPI